MLVNGGGDIMCLEIMVYRQHLGSLFDIHRFSHAKAIPSKLEFPELTVLHVLRAVSPIYTALADAVAGDSPFPPCL